MNLLFEIGTEELPAWYVTEGLEALKKRTSERLLAARLEYEELTGYATPRRLALVITGLAPHQARLEEERRGPPARVAFQDGKPTKAAEGFARKNGVRVEDLYERDGYVYARVVDEGQPAQAVLPELLAGVVRDLPAPKPMRWGNGEGPFIRPVRWLVALLDGEVLPLEVFGVRAGRETYGHRFLHPGPIPLPDAAAYVPALHEARVVVDPEVRRERVVTEAATLALAEGLEVVLPQDLLEEVTGLVEWPVGVMGRFDERYLELPDEVLAEVMIVHQRFFPVRGKDGRLTNRFIGISNHLPDHLETVRRGYEGVLEGRLADALFFWRADLKTPLAEHRARLKGINFHKGLGTMWDKAERVRRAAEALGEAVGAEPGVLREAAGLFRADLGTQMVYEFPELEGVMARAYAERQDVAPRVARALEEAVRPQGGSGALPESVEGALLSVLDRADTLVGFFQLGKTPSGSADPFGLRRVAVGLVRVLGAMGWDLPLAKVLSAAAESYRAWGLEVEETAIRAAEGFALERLEGLLVEAGLPVLAVRAAEVAPTVYGVMLRARLVAQLAGEPEFAGLQLLYKRAANLAREASSAHAPDPALFQTPEEEALYAVLPRVEAGVARLLEAGARLMPPWDPAAPLPQAALEALAEPLREVVALKDALDRFLDNVLVMVDDPAVRENRLALLRRVRDAVRRLGALEVLGG